MNKSPHQSASGQPLLERLSAEGWAALKKSDFHTAESKYLKAIEQAQQLKNRHFECVGLSFLSIARQNLGKTDLAKENLEQCLKIARSEAIPPVEAHSLFLLSKYYRQLGDSDSALSHLLQALEISVSADDKSGMETGFGNIGLIYLERGWAEQAAECFRQALKSTRDYSTRSAWEGSLGQAMAELGQFKLAIEHYQEACDQAVKSNNISAQAVCCGSQGNAWYELGQFTQAIPCYTKALKLSKKAGDLLHESIWSGNLANVYRRQGNFKKAISLLETALDLSRSLHNKLAEAAHLDSLGDCYREQNDLQPAKKLYKQALSISKDILDQQGERTYLANLGRVYWQIGSLDQAFEYFRHAIDLFDRQRSFIKTDYLKTSFGSCGEGLYKDMIEICLSLGRRTEALEYVGRAKSRAILDLLSNSPIDVSELSAGNDQELKELMIKESRLRNQIAYLEKVFWQNSPGEGSRGKAATASHLQKPYAEWREAISQLKRRHPNYANLVSVETLNFHELNLLWKNKGKGKAILSKNTAIIEYYWSERYLFTGALWPGLHQPNISVISNPGLLADLQTDLENFLEMSSTPEWEVPISLGQRLYHKLLAPLLEAMPNNIEQLILIPHNRLYRLPFGALHDGSQYLIERFALSYLPTASLIPILADLSKHSSQQPGYLILAINDYSLTRLHQTPNNHRGSSAGLDDLAYTQEEAQSIYRLGNKLTSKSHLLTNQEIKENLPQLFEQYSVVHFAGHAVFNPDVPMYSGLVFSDGSMLTAASILERNSLHTRTGKLMVLSACQTGVNTVTAGGEIIGLARALMYAGMPNLILSLWEVADRSSADLMQKFHKFWAAGSKSTISSALRQVQLQAVRQGLSVHAWAPFIHMGID